MEVMELIFLLERQQLLSVNVLQTLSDILVDVPHSPSLLLCHPGKHLSVAERSEKMVIKSVLITGLSTGCMKSTHDENPLKICLHKLQMHITNIHRPAKPESCSLHNTNPNTSFSYQDVAFHKVHSHEFFLEKTFIKTYSSSVDTVRSYVFWLTKTNTSLQIQAILKLQTHSLILAHEMFLFNVRFLQRIVTSCEEMMAMLCVSAPCWHPVTVTGEGRIHVTGSWSGFWQPCAWLTLHSTSLPGTALCTL